MKSFEQVLGPHLEQPLDLGSSAGVRFARGARGAIHAHDRGRSAVALMMALGPAGEIIRLSGDDAERIRPQLESAIRNVLDDYAGPDGVRAPSSTWIVTATAPGP